MRKCVPPENRGPAGAALRLRKVLVEEKCAAELKRGVLAKLRLGPLEKLRAGALEKLRLGALEKLREGAEKWCVGANERPPPRDPA